MTTRHTITHADELYAGNAFLDGDSPDGRRGIEMPHIYVREYGAVKAQDDDGILSSYTSSAVASEAAGVNLLPYATGAYYLGITTAGATQLTLDVPRNLTYMCTSAGGTKINIIGKDEHGQTMVESILATALVAGTYSSGIKAFKVIDQIYGTIACTSARSVGVGNRLGLPYHLSSLGKFLGYYMDGNSASLAASVATGLALATTGTSSENDPDVRGTFKPGTAPNATILFTAMMLVDHTTRNKAYGVPQCTAIS